MGHRRPTPKHLPAKLQAIRDNFGVSQYRLARSLEVGRTRLSEFEWGRRVPSFRVLIRYAKLAGIPLEFIVDDDIDLDYFKQYLRADSKRGELNDPPEPEDHHMVLFWRTSSADPEVEHNGHPCPGCGSPLERDAVSGRYLCADCDWEWEAWEVLDSLG